MDSDEIDVSNYSVTIPSEVLSGSRNMKIMRVIDWIICTFFAFRGVLIFLGPRHPGRLVESLYFIVATFLLKITSEAAFAQGKQYRCFKYVSNQLIKVQLERIAFFENESARASKSAGVRHEANRKRKADAKIFSDAGRWNSTAEAGRAIAERFHVEPKVAEKWIRSWRAEVNSTAHGGASSEAK